MKPSRQHDNHDSLAMLPWYPRDWRASTARAVMSALARGIYRELLDAAWLDGGSLPAEERTLIALAGCTVQEWRKAGPEVLPRFDLGQDGRLRQGRLSWQHERAAELREKQRKAALTATEARQRKLDAAHGDRDSDRGAQRDGDRNGDRTPPTPSPSPTPTPAPKEKQIPAPAAPAAKAARPDTWLTPYLAAWSERFPGSKPAAGKLAGFLAPLEKLHGPMLVLDHWRRYLERTEAQFVSPSRFAETFPSWGPGAREPTNGNGAGRGTVGQRTMETAQRLLVEFQARERGER